jgi:serine/threonine protein kinase
LEQIGKPGSFGVVRVALHLTTDVKYAVKIIAKDKMDARTRQQMRNEVIILVLAVYIRRQL